MNKKVTKQELTTRVINGGRKYSDGSILFHQSIGDILGVNDTDMRCLDSILLSGQASPGGLSELTGLSTGATTAMIDRLEKGKLVKRHPHPDDRRSTILVISKEGTQQLQSLFESLAMAMESLVSSYSEKELQIISDFLQKSVDLWNEERKKILSNKPKI